MAAFCSVFIGSDFSDGTIRNKLVSGCSRNAIYLSHLITCAAAGICMLAAYWLPALAAGMPFLGTFRMEGWIVFRMILAGILAIAAYAAVFTMMGMMIQNKTTTAILSLIGVIFVMFTVLFLISRINEPAFIDQVIYDINQIGSPESALTVPNPNYLTPAQRAAAQFVVDLLPTGQSLQIGSAQVRNLWRLPLYALGVIAVTGFFRNLRFPKKRPEIKEFDMTCFLAVLCALFLILICILLLKIFRAPPGGGGDPSGIRRAPAGRYQRRHRHFLRRSKHAPFGGRYRPAAKNPAA